MSATTVERPETGAPAPKWGRRLLGVLAGSLVLAMVLGLFETGIDIGAYKHWTRLVTLGGIESAYSGEYFETYAIYPPVTLYFYKAVGHIYQATVDPNFDLERALASQELAFLIRLVGIGFHVGLAAVIFRFVSPRAGPRAGLLASAAYALNPAALYDVALWSQPDSVHSFFLVLTLGLLGEGMVGRSWMAYSLAALTKPQAWFLGPLVVWATLVRFGVRRAALGALAALGVAGLVLLPFLLTGRMREVRGLLILMNEVMPVISAYAHNLWWLVSGGYQPLIYDAEPLWGPVTYRLAALALLAAVGIYALWHLGRWRRPEELYLVGAFMALGWFTVTTRAHENHAFMALPLLSLVWYRHRALAVLYAAVSVTLLVNMLLHDPVVAPPYGSVFPGHPFWWAEMANSAVNVVILLASIVVLARLRTRAAR